MVKKRFFYILLLVAAIVLTICSFLLFSGGMSKRKQHIGVKFVRQENEEAYKCVTMRKIL
ncbi:MAG: hypothetical protein BWY11_00640 [Firmicutes bacterium ADurb.Bin182]|nr:MAG: hypothetical protein BWY11_00640 [Firmicutes bacterium ADurb.Bin182]